MHLNEFTDPKIYALPADDIAAVLNQLENIWLDRGLEDDSPLINHLTKKPKDRQRKLMDKCRRDGTKRQSRPQHLSSRRSQ
jgi:hypothetical protein